MFVVRRAGPWLAVQVMEALPVGGMAHERVPLGHFQLDVTVDEGVAEARAQQLGLLEHPERIEQVER